MMKKVLKLFTWIILFIIAFIVLAGSLTQTPLFRNWLKEFVVSEFNGTLQGELSIEEIEGNIFSDIDIHNLLLYNHDDTLLAIPSVHLSYNLLSLLNKHIDVYQIQMNRPSIHLSEDSAGIWSFNKLLSKKKTPDIVTSEKELPFEYIISIDSLTLINGSANIETNNTLIPKKVNRIQIHLNGRYSSEEMEINLVNLTFQSEQPDFKLNKLGFNFSQSSEGLWVRNLILKTGSNQIESEGHYHLIKNSTFNLKSENLNLHEFEFVLPELKMKINPDIRISSRYNKDSLEFEIGIFKDEENILIHGSGENYLALIDSNRSDIIRFNLGIEMNNIRLHNWMDNYPLTTISGKIGIHGTYSGPDDLQATMSGTLNNLRFENYFVDSAQLSAIYKSHNLNGKIHLFSNNARLDLQLMINDLLEKPHYQSTLSVSQLNLAEVISSDNFQSDLNFNLAIKGEYFLTPKIDTAIELDLSQSKINDITIDTLSAAIQLSGSHYILKKFRLKTLSGIFNLCGSGDLESTHLINYSIDLGDLQTLAGLLHADTLSAKGSISGVISGEPESFTNHMDVSLQQLNYNEIKIDTLWVNTITSNVDSTLMMAIDLLSQNIKIGAVSVDQVNLKSNYINGEFTSEIDIGFNSDLKSSVSAIIRPDSILYLSIPRIEIEIIDEKWNGKLEKLMYDTGHNELEITDLDLRSTTLEDSGRFFAEGIVSFTDRENFRLQIEGFPPGTILSFLGMEGDINGLIDFNLVLSGTAQSPVFEGNLLSGKGYIGSINHKGIRTYFKYEEDKFSCRFDLDFNGKDSLTAIGYLPLHFSFTDTSGIFNPADSIDLAMRSEGIPIGLIFSNLKILPEISGMLLCDFTLKNSLLNPTIRGNLQLKNGLMRAPYWGIDYKNIELNISAFDDKFSLEKFQIFTTKGKINASGEIQLDYNNPKEKIIYSNLRILADKFYLVQHKDFEIQISTDIKYQMEQGKPKLNGYVDINKSSFYLPTILDRAGYVTIGSEEAKPLLVTARNRKLGINEIQSESVIRKSGPDTLHTPGFLDVIEGDIELRINRNTWIRNPQLRLELGGNLNLRMKDGDFFLKGPVNIIRGQYDLLGRRFTVIEGYIDFQGLKEVQPPIYLEAEYIYRTVGREKRALVLKVTGNIESPIVTFLDSNNEISQDDAIAIILYGRKTDELSFGTQTNITNESGVNTAAMGIISNIVSNQLSRSVGDNLQLDIIEVNATDNWQSANFVVGKYITDDIFVTYKREFGQNMDNNLYPETISMEYEIQKYLFLQLIEGPPQSSGLDFLFRYDWD